MKKVLFFIPTLTGGGAERVLVTAVNSLNPSKYEITVQTLLDIGVYQEKLSSHIRYKSIIKSKKPFIQKVFSYLIQFVFPATWVYNMYVKDNYDVEIAFLEGFPVKLIAASTNSKSKKYTWVHIDLEKYYIGGKVFGSIPRNIDCYKRFNKILCVSNDVRNAFYRRFGILENVEKQYNVINDLEIKEKAKEPIAIKKMNTISLVTIGRLCYQKGYKRLIKVAKELFDQGFRFDLFILGEGEDRTMLQNLIDEYGLQEHVNLIGFVSNPYPFIHNADFFVCSSYVEGFSTVATEALILGKPIITTDCAGMKDLLGESEYGMIVDNSDKGLYEGIRSFLTNQDMLSHYSEKALERAKDFSLNKRIQEYEKLLDE